MKETVMLTLLMAIMRLVTLEFVASQPVADATRLDKSIQLHDFNIMEFMPDAVKVEVSNTDNSAKMKIRKNQTVPKQSLPSSPVGLLRPDTFQFYTFNQNGDVVMKQMSEKEIHSLIASSGGHVPMEIHESQMIVETPPGETKVADVVQNVQNVLRSELNKPPSVMASMPTIPGHENSDWSHILPSILAGDADLNVTSKPDNYHDSNIMELDAQKPTTDLGSATFTPTQSGVYDTKPMIQVAVITTEKHSPIYDDKQKIDSFPIFHILNTITTDEKNKITQRPNQSSADSFESNVMPSASESMAPCPLTATNCSNHNVVAQKEHDDKLSNNSGSAERNKNETTNEFSPGYLATLEMDIDESIKNNGMEKSKPPILINMIETLYATQNPPQMGDEKIIESIESKPSMSINVDNATLHLGQWNNSTVEPQCHDENEESNVSKLTIKNSILKEKMDDTKTTIVISKNATIPHEIQLTDNDMTIIKLNSVIDQRIHAINGNQSITYDRPNVLNETLNNFPTEVPGMVYYDEILSTPPTNISHGSPSSVTPLDYMNMTIFASTPKVDETYSSTKIHISRTTTAPTSPEEYTHVNPNETTKNTIDNTNFNTTSDLVVSHKIYAQSTISIPIVSREPTGALGSTELIPTELANSLSSMISQISIAVPSIIPSSDKTHQSPNVTDKSEINHKNDSQPANKYETKPDNLSTKTNAINMSTLNNHNEIGQNADTTQNLSKISEELHGSIEKPFASNDDPDAANEEMVEKIHETPIVRIDIMETMPNMIQNINETLVNNSHDDYHIDNVKTESPMVRIKLTDPISTLNHILESSPVQISTRHGIEIVTLPTNENISANGIGSGLIAGFISNANESTSSKYSELISDNKGDEMVSNETSGNTDNTMRESVVAMNIITFSETTKAQTQSVDINRVSSSNPTEMNYVPITAVLPSTELIKTVNLSACSNQNSSSEQTNSGIKSLCSASTNTTNDNNEATTNAAEENINRPLHFTTISPYVSTKSFISNEVLNQKLTSRDPIIANLQEVRLDHTTETVVTPVTNKIQLEEKLSPNDMSTTISSILQSQYVSQHVPEHPDIKFENFSLNHEQSMKFKSPANHAPEQTYLYAQQGEVVSSKLNENTKKNSTMMTPTKIKDKKTDNLQIEPLEPAVTEKIAIISMKSDNTSASSQKPAILNKLNSTQEAKVPEKWTLIPQKNHSIIQDNSPLMTNPLEHRIAAIQEESDQPPRTSASNGPKSASGLDSSVEKLDADISYFSILCNDLAFKYWSAVNSGLSTSRSIALSPFGMTSILAMLFLGARSPTSDRMNDVLKLDDVTSFNPHLVFQNITDSVGIAQNQGIANVAFVRELFTDQSKVRKLMRFYKKQAEQFYDGMVEQVNFSTISDAVRRKTNFLIRKQTGGRIRNFVKTNTVPLRSPLAALSANVFQTDCNSNDATSRGRDGELYFAVSPAVRQRKLVLVPATLWKAGVLAGYEPSLDATAYAIGGIDKIVSTIFVIPGQQGSTATDDNLDLLEQRIISGVLHDAAWNKLLKVIVPRTGLELQIPKFSHKSIINATAALKIMGLENLFHKCADFKGINGVGNDFHLADVMQMNLFSTCGDENIQSGKTKHHVEIYPASPQRNARESKYDDNESDTDNNGLHKHIFAPLKSLEAMNSSFTTSTTQTIIGDKPRVKLDKPFLYFVRHNPTGLILFMGRFNPRLLP